MATIIEDISRTFAEYLLLPRLTLETFARIASG